MFATVIALQQTCAAPSCKNFTNKKWGLALKKILLAGIALGVLAAPAVAADMYVKAPLAPAPYYWTGYYAGINAGYADEQSNFTSAASPTSDLALGVVPGVSEGLAALSSGGIPTSNGAGFIGGGQVGYNLQLSSFLVAGLEADFQGKTGTSSGTIAVTNVVVGVPVTSAQTATASIDWLGTVRGRIGALVAPTWLVYFTGGLAYGGVNASSTLFQSGTNGFVGTGAGNISTTHVGWTLGGGVEWMFARNWSAKAEYLFYDLGTASFSYPATSAFFLTPVYQTVTNSMRFEGNIARAGINYHF
jgi:outer membrane immunogenic protein